MARLISGEEVNLDLSRVVQSTQQLIRITPTLILGVVTHEFDADLYIWQEKDGVYEYIGDFILKDLKEAISFKFFMSNLREQDERIKNAEEITKQADFLAQENTGFHFEFKIGAQGPLQDLQDLFSKSS